MKAQTFLTSALITRATTLACLLALWLSPTQAQQPYDYWNRPTNTSSSFQANRSSPLSQTLPRASLGPRIGSGEPLAGVSDEASRLDFERVRSAWENYRREALRSQSRYGEESFVRYGGRRLGGRSPNSVPVRAVQDPRTVSHTGRARDERVRPAANIQSIQSSGFGTPEPHDYRSCPGRGDADRRPRLAPTTPTTPYRELDRRELPRELSPFADEPRFQGFRRESFQNPEQLRAVPISESRADEQNRGTGVFSTPRIDPAHLASRAESFFSSHLGN